MSAVLDEVAGSAGQVVFLSGDAGIGKSRLAAEALELARQRGFVTLQGRAHPLHAGLAYAPVVEALGPYLAALDPPRRAELVSGLKELGSLFPGLRMAAPEPLGDPALEKMRLFEAVDRLMARIAERDPVVLAVDDVHWADPATVELVHYLGCRVRDRRALVLVTYRGKEPSLSGTLGEFVVSLRRTGVAVEVALGPLDSVAINDLLGDLLGSDPPPELVDAVLPRAAGVPLFVTAVVRQLIESGQLERAEAGWLLRPATLHQLPAIVRDVVLGRLTRLDADERRLFELVAVAGDAATPEVLQAVWSGDTASLERALRRLTTDALVSERTAGRTLTYDVAHPLYAEVAYAQLSQLDRRRMHAELATVVDQRRPDDVVALAPHYWGAGDLVDPVRTLQVLALAGRRALELHANTEATRYLGAALDRAGELGRRDLVPSLLDGLGQAYERCGEAEHAASLWQEGIVAAREHPDDDTARMLHHRLALLEWERGATTTAQEHLAAGLSIHGTAGGEVAEEHYIIIRLMLLGRQGDEQRQREAMAQLVTLAERSSSPAYCAAAHLGRAGMAALDHDYRTATAEAQQALDFAEQAGRTLLAGAAQREIALAAGSVGDLATSRVLAGRLVTAARQLGLPTFECSSRVTLAGVCHLAGDWDEALGEVDSAIALGRRAASPRAVASGLVWRAILLAFRGRLPQAQACLDEAEHIYRAGLGEDRNITTGIAMARATTARFAGNPQCTDSLTDDIPTGMGTPYSLNLLLLGEAKIAAGEVEGALSVVQRLRALSEAPLASALADRLEGLLATTRGETDRAARLLAAAAEQLDAIGAPVEAAQARLEWSMTVADRDPAAATATATTCLATFQGVGAQPWIDRSRRLLRTLGVRPAARAAHGTLSARETDVARLVAEGLSNSQIAARLFLSVRTVETHLHRIYTRLKINSRVALARWVSDQDARVT